MHQQGDESTKESTLRDDIRLYIEKRIQLISIIVSEQVSLMIAHSFQRLVGILLLAGAFLFAWIALAFYLGGLVDSVSAGFAIASVPLFILGTILFNRKSKRITERIQAELIGKVLENFDSGNGQQKTNGEQPE
jgi:membrane protein implicated in regulation of membrane protease activity